ncbi:MAG: sugar ABC transporter ATP-binding protein, partial [Spirochaetales bacterium]|nr:sugar ABC transporter ATP-binding protein [Spirochaetales bacterium]
MSDYILELKGITKIFPGVKALNEVYFKLKPGEIHALMGENGAGKSTFIKVITGVYKPEHGEIFLDGKRVRFHGPKDAQAAGIAAIYQHVTCFPDLTVTENIFVGHEIRYPSKRLNWKEMHKRADELLKSLGVDFNSKTLMGSLSVAQQQIVEIAKALSMKARIIIMDEPTAALTKRESEELYRVTEQLRDRDKASIIFISHRFEDMYKLASRVTVFRDANYIGSWDLDKTNQDELIVAMVGREVSSLYPKKDVPIGDTVLEVKNLARTGYFSDISFNLKKGEILGLTGLVGAGRTEVCESLFGINPCEKGQIIFDGNEERIDSPRKAMDLGIGYLPEDRQLQGLIMDWGINKNITLPKLEKFATGIWIDSEHEKKISEELFKQVMIKAPSVESKASTLSGGNQQKIVVAKLLATD